MTPNLKFKNCFGRLDKKWVTLGWYHIGKDWDDWDSFGWGGSKTIKIISGNRRDWRTPNDCVVIRRLVLSSRWLQITEEEVEQDTDQHNCHHTHALTFCHSFATHKMSHVFTRDIVKRPLLVISLFRLCLFAFPPSASKLQENESLANLLWLLWSSKEIKSWPLLQLRAKVRRTGREIWTRSGFCEMWWISKLVVLAQNWLPVQF